MHICLKSYAITRSSTMHPLRDPGPPVLKNIPNYTRASYISCKINHQLVSFRMLLEQERSNASNANHDVHTNMTHHLRHSSSWPVQFEFTIHFAHLKLYIVQCLMQCCRKSQHMGSQAQFTKIFLGQTYELLKNLCNLGPSVIRRLVITH